MAQAKERKRPSVLERLNPVHTLMYDPPDNPGPPVKVEVRPLRAAMVPDCLDLLDATGARLLLGSWKALARESHPALMAVIDECCTIPEDPSLVAKDFPVALVSSVLLVIIDQNISMGNWETLGRRIGLVQEATSPPINSETPSVE